MAPLLRHDDDAKQPAPWRRLDLDPSRPLLVGVLPHTFCNPSVRGCGFCTFPHEKHSNGATRSVVERVVREVRAVPEVFPEAMTRHVPALYFGGGTANLTPPESFAELARALAETFDLRDAEISLEGVAPYFLSRNQALLDVLERDLPASCHRRLSMGIQTFDRDWIAKMGRSAFGTEDTFAKVREAAHARGMSTSCDLLYNLPGQTLDASRDDVTRASDLGFDQICIYNLVLDASIDAEWAHSRSLLNRMHAPDVACERWLALRETLFALGFVQTTLTNFERSSAKTRFVYELASFDARASDALGFGPGAISTFTAPRSLSAIDERSEESWVGAPKAIKWMNAGPSREYSERIDRGERPRGRAFDYASLDLKLLHITRALSSLAIDRARYATFFGSDVVADFSDVVEAASAAGLVAVDAAQIALTPCGMFYADAVAGLFAWRRAAELRDENDAIAYAMG